MLHIKRAFNRAFSELKPFLWGLLFFHPVLYWLFGTGYELVWGRSSFQGEKKPPKWALKEIFLLSIKSLVIITIYILPIIVIGIVLEYTLGFNYGDVFSNPQGSLIAFYVYFFGEGFDKNANIFIFTIFLIMGFFFNVISSAIVLVFAINNKFSKGFAIKEILHIAFSKKFFLVWLAYLPFDYVVFFVAPSFMGFIIKDRFLPEFSWIAWVVIWGFVPAFFYYIYNTTYNTLQGEAIRELKYKPSFKKK